MAGGLFRILLAGNAGSGKTTILNRLAGSRQHVSLYPGTGIERRVGRCPIGEFQAEVIDLPGMTGDETADARIQAAFQEVARNDIDLVVNVVDAANAVEELILVLRMVELEVPMLLVFNKIDEAERLGVCFSYEKLAEFFKAPLIPVEARSGRGMVQLTDEIARLLRSGSPQLPARPKYGPVIDEAIEDLIRRVEPLKRPDLRRIPLRVIAIGLLSGTVEICERPEFRVLLGEVARWRETIAERTGFTEGAIFPERRRALLAGACRNGMITTPAGTGGDSFFERLATRPRSGTLLFLVKMFIAFSVIFLIGQYPSRLLAKGFVALGRYITAAWPDWQSEFLSRFLVEGVLGGVGAVVTLLPFVLLFIFLFVVLEGSGCLARAAFAMERLLRFFRLDGRGLGLFILGFGCSIPALSACRAIESKRERLLLLFVLPFLPCAARLTIAALLIAAYFPPVFQAAALWVFYLCGIGAALVALRLLRPILGKEAALPPAPELPPCRFPPLGPLLRRFGSYAGGYLTRGGLVIALGAIVLFFCNTYPERTDFRDIDEKLVQLDLSTTLSESRKIEEAARLHREIARRKLEYSISGRIGQGLAFCLSPLGFDQHTATVWGGGLVARELFIVQAGILHVREDYASGEETMFHPVGRNRLEAISLLLFTLLCSPCLGVFFAIRRAAASWKPAFLQLAGSVAAAYLITLAVYQLGLFLRLGTDLFPH